MSLSRSFWNEFRPLFRMLEEPFGGHMAPFGLRQRGRPFDHPFFREGGIRPSVDLTEDGNTYVVEAELPGVKKDNIEVNIGDGGQSVTIQGRIQQRSAKSAETGNILQSESTESSSSGAEGGSDSRIIGTDSAKPTTAVTTPLPLNTERYFAGDTTFARTLWLPREIDQSKVTAKLEDGVLTVRLPKADAKGSLKINVE